MSVDYKYLFLLCSFSVFCYVSFSRRVFDYFSLISFSSIFYFLPLFFGEINLFGVIYGKSIHSLTYLYASVYFFILFVAIILFEIVFGKREHVSITESFESLPNIIYIFAFIIYLVGVYVAGITNLINPDKTNLAQQNTAFYGFGLWFMCCALLKARVSKHKFAFFVCFICVLFSLYVGSRSMFVIALLSIVLVELRTKRARVVGQITRFLILLFFIIFLVLFKVSYKKIKDGDFSGAVSNIISIDFLDLFSLIVTDPNAVMYNFNHTIESNIFLGWDYLFHRLLSIFPLLSSLFSAIQGQSYSRFSSILSDDYGFHFGLASSIHGELLAVGGLGFFVASLVLFMILLFVINYYYLFRPSQVTALFIPFAVYNFFYSFRVDITFVLGTIKTYVVIVLFFFLYRQVALIFPKR